MEGVRWWEQRLRELEQVAVVHVGRAQRLEKQVAAADAKRAAAVLARERVACEVEELVHTKVGKPRDVRPLADRAERLRRLATTDYGDAKLRAGAEMRKVQALRSQSDELRLDLEVIEERNADLRSQVLDQKQVLLKLQETARREKENRRGLQQQCRSKLEEHAAQEAHKTKEVEEHGQRMEQLEAWVDAAAFSVREANRLEAHDRQCARELEDLVLQIQADRSSAKAEIKGLCEVNERLATQLGEARKREQVLALQRLEQAAFGEPGLLYERAPAEHS